MEHEGFSDRAHAGRQLASRLKQYAGRQTLVLALPRGGVPVAFPVAEALHAELDLMLVRKLGLPGQEEFAMGAIAGGGVRVLQPGVPGLMGVTQEQVDAVTRREEQELARRERRYRGARPQPALQGRIVILVDDGIATGATMAAAVEVARRQRPSRLVVAAPVGAPDTVAALEEQVDEVVCLVTPPRFRAVGQWYRRFDQTTDEEVQDLLAQAWAATPGQEGKRRPQPNREEPT
ncbi:phosphoribosyltransferase [Massilia sp. ST3]|uniref:phosphoribosyltransferase n=1 Tax=Massilia sp. ST3 TaxID=2824903 RepID=UPI001B835331|nr:phosphoribosyltransferase [Massilia sp. ST3]MBQ5949958.1 phosphoribosyltransferase [Massilia sp. ST3]